MSYDIQIGLACKTVGTKAEVDHIVSILAEVGIPTEVKPIPERYCPWGHAVYEGFVCDCGSVIEVLIDHEDDGSLDDGADWITLDEEYLLASEALHPLDHSDGCTCHDCMTKEMMEEAGRREEGERLAYARSRMADGVVYTSSDMDELFS
jgi:hypothetical protein